MSLYLPPELRWLGYVAGSEWPDGDEDHIWDVSGYWKDAAKALRAIDPLLQTAKSQAVSAYPQGSGADGVSKMFDQLLTGEQSLDQLADYMDSLGEAAFNMGTQVQAAKLMVVISLIALAIEIAWAWLFPPTAPAQEAASIGVTQVVVRALAKLIGERILATVARTLGEKFAGLAGKFVLEILKSALISGGVDGAVQLGQMADGKRKNFDVKEFGAALAGGAIAGAGGKAFGDWFGKQSSKLFGDLTNPWMRGGHGALVGIAGGEFGNVAGNLGGALVTGDWNGFANGAGWTGGAVHGGLGGGIRSYRGGFEMPGGTKNFEVPGFGADGGSFTAKPHGFGEEPPSTTPAGFHGGGDDFNTNGPYTGPKVQIPDNTHSGPTNEPVNGRGPGDIRIGDLGGQDRSVSFPPEQKSANNGNSQQGQGDSSGNGQGGGKSTIPAAGESPDVNAPKSPTESPGVTNDKPTPIAVSGGDPKKSAPQDNSANDGEKATSANNSGNDGNSTPSRSTPVDDSTLSNGPKVGSSDGPGDQKVTPTAGSSTGSQVTGNSSANNRANSPGSGFSAGGNGDGTVRRPSLSINTDVPPVHDEVSPLSPGEKSPLTGDVSPMTPVDKSNPWNSPSSSAPNSSPLASDPSVSRPTQETGSSSPATATGSGSPASNTGAPPPRASAPSASTAGGAEPAGGPMSASSKGTPGPSAPTSSTSGASSTGGTVRSSPIGPAPSSSPRPSVSGLSDGSSTPPSSRLGVTAGGGPGAGTPGGRTADESAPPPSTSAGPQTQGATGGRGGSGDGPLPPYGSRPNGDSPAPHAGSDGHGLGGHTGGGLAGGSHSGMHDEQPPSWERNPDGSITVHLSDGTEVHVQDGFVFVGSHAGGSAAPHSYDRDGVVRFPRPNGSTVTVKPNGETTVAARAGGTTRYEPDGTKIEFGPGSNHTIVTTPDGIVHRVPNDRQGWTKGEDGFTVTSHDGTTHTVDSDGNIVVKHAGDDHGIKVSSDGSVGFVDSHGQEMTPAGRPGKGAGQFDQQTFGRPDRVTHTVLPDGGGVRTTGPDGSTTTVKPDGTTEFKSPSGHTVTHDPEGLKVEFGPEQPTVVTHADGTSHAVPTDKGSWNKNSDGDIVASSPDGTAHTIPSGGGPIRVGRGADDPHRFTVHRPGDSAESKDSTGIVGALKSQVPTGAFDSIKSRVSDTFGSGNFDEHGVEFHGPGDKSVTVQVSSNGTVKATGSDGSTITVKKNGSAEFVSGDGVKTGFGSGGKESGSKRDWAGNDATWSKQGDDVHMTAPDGTHITVDGEGNILLSHPGDSTNMIKVTPEHDIAFGRPDTTGHTVRPDGTVHTRSPDGTETTVQHDGTMKITESNGNVTLTKSSGTVVQHSPDGPTVVSGHDGTVQTAHPHGAVKVSEVDGTVHTIENAADPRGGRSTKFPDGSTTTVEKGPESPGAKDQILGDGKPPSVGLRRPDDTELVVDNKGNLKVTDPNGTVYEKDSKGNVTVTRPGVQDGEAGPIGSKGGAVKLSNGATLENTSDGFKVFHTDSVSEVGKGGVKFTDMRGDTRTTRPDGMITVTKPDGSSRDVRSDGSVRDTKPDGTSEGSRPDGTTWTVDENNKVHLNDPDGTQRPPTDRLSPHLTGGQLVPVKSNWTRDPSDVTPPGPIAFEAPHAPVAEEWLAGDPNLQNPPDLQPPPENWPPPWDYNWQPPPWDYYNNWPPPWSHNWDHFPGPHNSGDHFPGLRYPGDHSAGGAGGGPHHMPDLSALNNMAREQGAALRGPTGMHVPNLSAGQLAGLSHMANMPGLSNLAGLGGLSPQALSGLSNIPGLSGLSPSQLGGLSQFSPQQLSALSPSQLQTLSGLSPARQQALAGLSPQQLAGMSPAQLAGLTGLTPAQQAALSPSQLGALSGLSPAQQSALAGMPASELAGLSPSQLSALQGMTPQQLAQLSKLSPQQLANALNAAQAHQGSNGGLGDIAGLQRGLNGLAGTNGLSGLGDALSGLANSANPALSALTNALTGQHNQMPSLGAQDMLNSLAHNTSGAAPDGQGAPGAGGSGAGGSGGGADVASDSSGGQQDPSAQYGPDAAKSMAAIAGGGGGSSAGSGDGLANHHPLQQEPALQDQAAQGGMGQGAGGAPGSPGAPGRQPSEGEGGESSKKKDRKKKEPKKRAIPKSVLMLSPDEEIEADESDAADAAGAEVDVKFTMGGPSGAQAGSGIKVTPEVVTRMPNGEPPGG